MAFSENLKLKLKKESHFSCCLCHTLGVEIHHIVPQAEGGPDSEENAAPLCPTCHELYGANPEKRKFIREARDFWYELCEKRFAGDAELLREIANRLDQVALKSDLSIAIENLTKNIGVQNQEQLKDEISIHLPERYWVVVLGALEMFISKGVQPKVIELRKQGFNFDNVNKIPDELRTVIVGALFARARMIDVFIANHVLKPELSKHGEKGLQELVNKSLEESGREKIDWDK